MITKEQIWNACVGTELPAVRILPYSEGPVGCTDSRFGGPYFLPAGASVPTHPEGGEMELLAQINFARVPRLQGFPEKGLLQFFLCTEAEVTEDLREEASVWPSSTGLFQLRYYPDVPANGPAHADHVPEDRWYMEKVNDGMWFRPVVEQATVGIHDDFPLTDLGFEAVADAVDQLVEQFYDEGEDRSGEGYDPSSPDDALRCCADFGNWGHKLGGHPALRQEDLRREDPAYRAYTTLLFQFDLTETNFDPENFQFYLEDETICFFIKPEDLAARRFDDVLLVRHNRY